MKINASLKTVVLSAAGVVLAGLILNYGRDISFLKDAHDGFDRLG